MAQPGFIFGENAPDTYESLQAKRRTADRLGLAAMKTPKNLGEGLASLGQAIMYRRMMGQADRGDAAGRAASDSAFAQIMAGMGGMGGGPRVSSSGTWDKAPPPPKPTDLPGMGAQPLSFGSTSRTVDTPAGKQNVTGAPIPGMPQIGGGGLDFGSATMTPQEMLIAGAEARGWNPIDVATAISYETGGKFDPMISGPTTQWGTHQGLIQFGEPQAAEHGADFTDPNTAMRSQLDPTNGAVWSYLENAGVKPGMGLDDIYSAINAGAPGRYGASDANNGGAPGTVADKVAGMGDHRGTAADWLGGTWTPSDNVTVSTQGAAPQGGGASIPALMEAMSDPYASEAQKSVLGMLLQQQLTAMQPQSEEEMLRLQQLRIQTAEMQNPGKKDPIEVNGVLLDPDTYEPLYDGRDAPKPLEVGGVLLDPVTKQPIFDSREPPKPTSDVQNYEYYRAQEIAEGRVPLSIGQWSVMDEKAGVAGTPPGVPADDALRKKLMEAEGTTWGTYLGAGNTAAGVTQDMELLGALADVAPQGPLEGRLAEMFPGVSSAGDAFQSVIKRVAPTLRVEGSGSQSDIEYNGFLQSLPSLKNKPEANKAIIGMMKAKAALNMERAKIVRDYQNGALTVDKARNQMAALEKRSIMTPEVKQLIEGLGPQSPVSPEAQKWLDE